MRNIRSSLGNPFEFIDSPRGEKILFRATAAISAGMLILGAHSCIDEFQDMAIRRKPPAGSTCTIIDMHSDAVDIPLEDADDIWFEGKKDVFLGDENIEVVVTRNVRPGESFWEANPEVRIDYAICDYPGPSYANGGRRSVVNPDNVDPTAVTVVPVSEFPQSLTVD